MWSIVKNEDLKKYFDKYPELYENKESVILHQNDKHAIFPKYFYKNYPSIHMKNVNPPVNPITTNIEVDAEMRPEQKNIINGVMKLYNKNGSINGIIKAKTGVGKGLTLDTFIRIPNGWTQVKNIKCGDDIIAYDGTPCVVEGVYPQGEQQIYTIIFEDGRYANVDGSHLWSIKLECSFKQKVFLGLNPFKTSYVMSTKKIIHLISKGIDVSIPLIIPEDNKNSEIVYDIDNDIKFILNELKNYPKNNSSKCLNTYRYADLKTRITLICKLVRTYLCNTDSYNKVITFNTINREFAFDLLHIIRSIGCKVELRHYLYNLYDNVIKDLDLMVYTLDIKCDIYTYYMLNKKYIEQDDITDYINNIQYNSLKIRKIEENGVAPTICIKISHPSELYIINDFIVTHNTVVSLKLASMLKYKTLILVDSDTLLKQWIREILNFTKFTEDNIGIIKQKFFDIEKPIIVAMLQTLMSKFKQGPSEIYDSIKQAGFGFVIYDEVHKSSASEKYAKISSILPIPNCIGLSATPYKYAIQDVLMKNTIGDIIYDSTTIKLKPVVNFMYYESKLTNIQKMLCRISDMNARRQVYNKHIVKSKSYLDSILKYAKEDLKDNHKIMIVCFTQSQVQAISEHLTNNGIDNAMFYGKSRTYDGSKKVQVVTYSFAGTGFDDKELSCLYYATPLSGKVSLIQTAGRILRECPGKTSPIIRDFIDLTFPSLYMNELGRKRQIFADEYECDFNIIQVNL